LLKTENRNKETKVKNREKHIALSMTKHIALSMKEIKNKGQRLETKTKKLK
jgi:hypothetical protein